MSQLVPLLNKLKESGAERIFLAPGGPVTASTLLEAISEVLSYDELRDLPDNRPRIVRHEHAGEDYILEIVRQAGGIGLGIRFAAVRPVRTPTVRETSRDSVREVPKEPPKEAPKEEIRTATTAETKDGPAERPRSLSRRKLPAFRSDKRTLRIEVDDEGNPVDSVAIDIDAPPARAAQPEPKISAKVPDRIHSIDTKQVARPDLSLARAAEPEPFVAGEAKAVGPARGEGILQAMLGLDSLADLPRTGWLLRGVRPCESIADHSFGVAFLAMLFVDAIRADGGTIDGESTLRMALVHDAAEAKTGDVPMPNKTPRMTEALHELEATLIRDLLPPRQQGEWAGVEAGKSLEARVVKAADKAQMMIKALAYERQQRGQLDDFWSNPQNFDDRGIAVARELFAALAAAAGRELPRRVAGAE